MAAFVASRALVAVAATVGYLLRPADTPEPWPEVPMPHQSLLQALGVWDTSWYAAIARDGYPTTLDDPSPLTTGRIGFFPLFPAIVRIFAGITGLSHITAAILVASLFGALATVLVWQLARRLLDDRTADRAVVLFCFFPASFVLSMGYAEGLLIAAAVACLWALEDRQWWLAGAAAAVATAARPNGLVLAACCAWAAVAAIRERRQWAALVAPALAPLGIGLYFVYLEVHSGSVAAWFTVQDKVWHETVDFGAETVRRIGVTFTDPAYTGGGFAQHGDANMLVATVGLAVTILCLVALWSWRPPATVVIYAVGIVVLAAVSKTLGLRPRFVLTAFPLFFAAARVLRDQGYATAVAGSAGVLACLTTLTIATIAITP